MRKITSLTALLSFILLMITIVILYIVPQGRIAYWADWRLWGFTKEQWGNLHINLGLLFILSIFLHVYYNWKTIVSYLKNRARQIKVFTREFNAALIVVIVFALGTLFFVPPFSWVIDVNGSLKDAAARKFGEPPYGHAELSSLKTFAAKTGLDPAQSIERLKKTGIRVDSPKLSIKEIAKANGISPQQVYAAIKPDKPSHGSAGSPKMPATPTPGLGRRSLADVCQQYRLNIPTVLRGLKDRKLAASSEMSIKQIAERSSMNPVQVYEMIRELSLSASPQGTDGGS